MPKSPTEILQAVNYPTTVLVVDFESYFTAKYSLKKISTIEYITSPLFELLGCGLAMPGNESIFIDGPDVHKTLPDYDWSQVTVVVHNARFDVTVMQLILGFVPPYIIDILDLARHYDSRAGNSVAQLCVRYGLPHKGDTELFKNLRFADLTTEKYQELVEYTLNDVDRELELFNILLPLLSNIEFEIRIMEHTLNLWLQRTFSIDYDRLDRIAADMTSTLDTMIQKSGHTLTELRSAKFAEYLQEALPPGEKVPMKMGGGKTPKMIPALAKSDVGCQLLEAHPKEQVRNLISARLNAKSWPTHIKKLQKIKAQAQANGGDVRIALNYYGCHTGRPSGGEKINQLNMGGKGAGLPTHPLVSEMRNTLIANPGCVLGICDSAQVEARIAAWLAGCTVMIESFRDGSDIYSKFISPIVGVPVRKPYTKENPGPNGMVDPKMVAALLDLLRGFGKTSILGYQYGLGAKTQHNKFLANPRVRPLFDSGKYDFRFVKSTVDMYRRDFKEIPQYWSDVEQAFKKVLRFPHLTTNVGDVGFECEGHEVRIILPSGRILYYPGCRIGTSDGGIRTSHGPLWGGAILENIDQSICRDLLYLWAFQCEEEGLPVILVPYDEIVTMLPEDKAEDLIKVQHEIMCTLPDWAAGLPVAAESKLSKFYCK